MCYHAFRGGWSMKKSIRALLPTILFVFIVAAILMINSIVSGKLHSLIPTYKGQSVHHKNNSQINITKDLFTYRDLMFDIKNIIFTDPTEQEYAAIWESDVLVSIMDAIGGEAGEVLVENGVLLQDIKYSIFVGFNESGEKKYYINQGYKGRDKRTVQELMVIFSIEGGVELFVFMDSMDNMASDRGEYTEVRLDNSLRRKLVRKAEEYVENFSDNGLIKDISELYFPTKYITSRRNICYIQDSQSQITVYYDIMSDKIVGFQRGGHRE